MNDETENNAAAPEPTHVEADAPVVVEADAAPIPTEEPAPVVDAPEVAASASVAHGLLSEIENGLEELLHSPFALVAFVKGKIAEVRKHL